MPWRSRSPHGYLPRRAALDRHPVIMLMSPSIACSYLWLIKVGPTMLVCPLLKCGGRIRLQWGCAIQSTDFNTRSAHIIIQ